MKWHIRFDRSDAAHTTLTLFVNGANTGTLTLRTDEALEFHNILSECFAESPTHEFVSSGAFYSGEEESHA